VIGLSDFASLVKLVVGQVPRRLTLIHASPRRLRAKFTYNKAGRPENESTTRTMSDFPSSFLEPWKHALKSHRGEQLDDFPNYYISDAETLVTKCRARSIGVGTGESIYKTALLPAILSAKKEIILVTCFWAKSPTLAALGQTLGELAERRRQAVGNGDGSSDTLRIRICFSSRSAIQKLFHTWSKDGHVCPPKEWPKMGLPEEKILRAARIEMRVKSLFFLPFSVMHPKFLIVDRRRAWMPSCNVSWETWFEGCVEFDGDAVGGLARFYESVWGRGDRVDGSESEFGQAGGDHQLSTIHAFEESPQKSHAATNAAVDPASAHQWVRFDGMATCPVIILPSSHHRNPRFNLLPFWRESRPPTTPLNAALLTLFDSAQSEIHILTPNLTCKAVVSSILGALQRGVNVKLWTSRNMMLLEQLVTAGTTTEWTLKGLIKRYRQMCDSHLRSRSNRRGIPADVEADWTKPGHFEIMYYHPSSGKQASGDEQEPVLSHFKMTLVDRQYLVLGSGNMDRASWYTSQELGILLYMPGFDHDVWAGPLASRLEVRFRGHGIDGDAAQLLETRCLTAGSST
jgi:phosphatidylserine/phosphatidylglycerophosphate/cardiolipin synthase-like enzyme